MKKEFPRLLILLLLAFVTLPQGDALAAPNILVILADDAGYADFGFQGGGIAGDFASLTPNIDSLARNGVKFTNGYVSGPICCPSRAGLLTGRYEQRFGMEGNIQGEPNVGLPASEKTIANTLRALNYRTYALGKWHLGSDLPEQLPNQRGFDEYYGFLGGSRTYFQYTGPIDTIKLQRNGVFIPETRGQYMTDMLGREAAAYIDSHARNYGSQPFFMYLAFNGVHAPLEADSVRLADPRIQGITVPERKTLAAMTIALDDAVGNVLTMLQDRGMTEDTLIVFLSDNGGPETGVQEAPNWSSNGPLRGNKTLLYEGGIRVPFVVKWPARIAAELVSGSLPDPVISLDLLPTFVAAANGTLLPGQTTDGLNLLPRLTGASPTPLQRSFFWRTGGCGSQGAARIGDWKLYRGYSDELYNLATDLGETTNLAETNPAKLAEMVANFESWGSQMVEPLWGSGAPVTSANLQRRSAPLGYELEKTGSGYSYMTDGLNAPLSLAADWELAWSMESVSVPGYQRNGSIVLGDSPTVGRLIRISVNFASGAISITELQNGSTHTGFLPTPIPAGEVREFRVSYVAATRTLTFRSGSTTLSHVLTGTYTGNLLDYAGYGLQSSALTRFSPITPHITPRAAAASPTWARMKVARDFSPGTYDAAGSFLGGTELMALVAHQGKLFAASGYWNDVGFGVGAIDPYPGPQVLVKPSANQPWKQDLALGVDYLRIECLRSLTITTDKNGAVLNPPVTLLLAGSGEIGVINHARRAVVFVRNAAGAWSPTYPGGEVAGTSPVRMIFDHLDSVTGIHELFAGYGESNATVVRGGYNAATGLIDWDSATPELAGTQRIHSAGNCNGVLYACIGSTSGTDNSGGIFWRQDGSNPQWNFVCKWPVNTGNAAIRGFTAVPHPKGLGYDVALVSLESQGKIYSIDPVGGDPRNGHIVTEELNIQSFLGDEWSGGAPVGFPTVAAYNDMPEVLHPATMQPVNLIGLGVSHPLGATSPEGESAYFLIRHHNGKYEWSRVFDPSSPLPLKALRAVSLSPFPEDQGRVLFFGGYDATAPAGVLWHNTAWLYRAVLPQETPQVARFENGSELGLSVIADTAHGWLYQLESSNNLTNWNKVGSAFAGNNDEQSLLMSLPQNVPQEYYRWRISRP